MASELEDLKKILSQKGREKYAEKVDEIIKESQLSPRREGTWPEPEPQLERKPGVSRELPTSPQEGESALTPEEMAPSKPASRFPASMVELRKLLGVVPEEGGWDKQFIPNWNTFIDSSASTNLITPELATLAKSSWREASEKLGYGAGTPASALNFVKAMQEKAKLPVAATPVSEPDVKAEIRSLLHATSDAEIPAKWTALITRAEQAKLIEPDMAAEIRANWSEAAKKLGYTGDVWQAMAAYLKVLIPKLEEAGYTSTSGGSIKVEETPKVDALKYLTDSINLMAGATADKLKFNTPFRPEKRQVARWLKRFFGDSVEAAAKAALDAGGEEKWLTLIQEDITAQGSKDQKGRTQRSGNFFETLYQTLRGGAKELRQSQRTNRRNIQRNKPKPTPAKKPAPRRRRASERLDRVEHLFKEASKKK